MKEKIRFLPQRVLGSVIHYQVVMDGVLVGIVVRQRISGWRYRLTVGERGGFNTLNETKAEVRRILS